MSFCSVDGCIKQRKAHGLCATHLYRQQTYGSTDRPPHRKRVRPKVAPDGYVHRIIAGHPLASEKTGFVREHRVVLYDKIGPGPHPCHWCGTLLEWTKDSKGIVVDHLDEVRQNNEPDNLVPSCSTCNTCRAHFAKWVRAHPDTVIEQVKKLVDIKSRLP